VRYLGAKHGSGTLVPTSLTERADADRWMDWQTTTLSRAMGEAFLQWVRTPPEQRDDAAAERSALATLPLLQILDDQLAGRDNVCGASFTMADISLGCAAHRWFGLPLQHDGIANVRSWYTRLMQRPAVQGVLTLPLQ
jgi:glutathione S-transferase